jgi:hypothetical protein
MLGMLFTFYVHIALRSAARPLVDGRIWCWFAR